MVCRPTSWRYFLLAISELTSECHKSYKVVLTGDGGDELFGGYEKYLRIMNGQAISDYLNDEYVLNSNTLDNLVCTTNFLSCIDKEEVTHLFNEEIKHVSKKELINQVMYFDMRQLLPGNNLVKIDRMTMAHSIEARSPLLDYRLFEILLRIPGDIKFANGQTRVLQKKLAESYLPSYMVHRKKKMLAIPVGEWIRSSLKSYFEHYFQEVFDYSGDIFQKSNILKLLKDHIEEKNDNRRAIRALMAFDLWKSNIK